MAAQSRERIGKVDEQELREIREVHQTRCALVDLFRTLASSEEQLYERVVEDMGHVAMAFAAWWERGAREHRWPGVVGGSWRIDLATGELFLCDREDAELAGCRWPCRRSMSRSAPRPACDAARCDATTDAELLRIPVPDDDTTIVPGVRIGPHALSAPPAELARLGRPDRAFRGSETLPIDPLPTEGVLLYSQRRLSFVIHAGRVEEIATTDPRFRLQDAIVVGARRDAVVTLLGPPDEPPPRAHKELLAYRGVVFEIDSARAVVRRISVRRATRRGA
jgi:CXXX repeat modification system protein